MKTDLTRMVLWVSIRVDSLIVREENRGEESRRKENREKCSYQNKMA